MGIMKGLTFDGIKTLDYNVGITGEAVYNSPERDVEMIEIAGRNGAFALDRGRFRNIEVSYPSGAFGTDQTDFAEKISDLRNELSSRIGYKRLEDEYNPDEYRMAVYKTGLEVSPVAMSKAGQFDIVFDCKPQRYLKSGETEQAITSGGSISNPTKFESNPLLLVDGYGNIDIEGQAITINSSAIGNIEIASVWNSPQTASNEIVYTPNLSALNNGDKFYLILPKFQIWAYGLAVPYTGSVSASWTNPDWTCSTKFGNIQGNDAIYFFGTYKEDTEEGMEFTKGTNAENTYSWTATVTRTLSPTYSVSVTLKVKYSNGNITFSIDPISTEAPYQVDTLTQVSFQRITGNSTKSALGNIYIDCEIGEAYKVENGEIISVNNAVILPAELPTLKPGTNTITFDNTITNLKITPKWWKI